MIWLVILALQLLLKANSERVFDVRKYGAKRSTDISQVTNQVEIEMHDSNEYIASLAKCKY